MLEVRLLIDAPQDWIKAVSQGRSGLVKITDIRSSGGSPNAVQDFVEISSSKMNARDMIDTISDSLRITDCVDHISGVHFGRGNLNKVLNGVGRSSGTSDVSYLNKP